MTFIKSLDRLSLAIRRIPDLKTPVKSLVSELSGQGGYRSIFDIKSSIYPRPVLERRMVKLSPQDQIDVTELVKELGGQGKKYGNVVLTTRTPADVGKNYGLIYYRIPGRSTMLCVEYDKQNKVNEICSHIALDNLSASFELYGKNAPLLDEIKKHLNLPVPNNHTMSLEACRSNGISYMVEREREMQSLYNPSVHKGWKTTDPNVHNVNDFLYIVHGVTSERDFGAVSLAAARSELMKSSVDGDIVTGNAFHRTEEFLNRKFISASLIDQVHRATFRPVGVILEVPRSNIVAASHTDMGSMPSAYLEKGRRFVPENVSAILEKTSPNQYNEIIVSGTDAKTGNKSKITGVFIIKNIETGEPVDRALAEDALTFAQMNNLPVVNISEPINPELMT